MSVSYTHVQWNVHKRRYDAMVVAGVLGFVGIFMAVAMARHAGDEAISAPILLMRALGTCAIVLLHVVLCIGPLHRLDKRFAPLLYNRRHLGVILFLVAMGHAIVALGFYGGFGVRNPVSALVDPPAGATSFASISRFPFEVLGLAALVILFAMAATSHDFWLKNLSPRWWKTLHMGVYGAYALLIGHVALGIMQSERALLVPTLLVAGIVLVSGLHIAAGAREWRRDARVAQASDDGWVDVGEVREIPESRARVVCVGRGERVAVYRTGDTLSAIANVCAHQGGPLGEGKIIDGCVTCPWHGYQYVARNGQSPPPFTEKIATYELRLRGGRVEVNPRAKEPGTPVEPLKVEGEP